MISSISSSTNYWYQQYASSVSNTSSKNTDITDTDLLELLTSDETSATKDSGVTMPPPPMGPSSEEEESSDDISEELLSQYDTNGDGIITSEEYEAAISDLGAEYSLSADKFFSLFDTDEDGEITSEELNAADKMGPPPAPETEISDEILSEYDTDGDGTLSYEEYDAMMTAYESNRQYMFGESETSTIDSLA